MMNHVNALDTDHDRHPDAGTEVTVDFCESCDQVVEETVIVYECGTCGATSQERRCENCHRFAARREEPGCPDCLEPVVEKTLVVDLDGALIEPDDYLPQGPAYAERQKVRAAAEQSERERKSAEKAQTQQAASRATTWGQIRVGDRIAGGLDQWGGVSAPVVVHVMTAADGTILAATEEYGLHIERHPATEPVRILIDPLATHEPAEPLGSYVLLDGDPEGSSSPVRRLLIQVGPGTQEVKTAPLVTLLADAGNMILTIGTWFDPALAAEGLDVLEATAHRLAEALDVSLDVKAGKDYVRIEEPRWISASGRLPREVAIRVGPDPWHRDVRALANLRVNGQSVVLGDPHALAYAVDVVRGLLGRLTGVPSILA